MATKRTPNILEELLKKVIKQNEILIEQNKKLLHIGEPIKSPSEPTGDTVERLRELAKKLHADEPNE
jgi:hypothetical protein